MEVIGSKHVAAEDYINGFQNNFKDNGSCYNLDFTVDKDLKKKKVNLTFFFFFNIATASVFFNSPIHF